MAETYADNVRALTPRRFQLIRFDEIRIRPGRNYIVKGLIPKEALAVVYGPQGCGKSFWTLDLMMHVALGWQYRNRRVGQGTVVYVACEGEHGLAQRVEAFRCQKMSEVAAADSVPFYLVTTTLNLPQEHGQLVKDIEQQLEGDCAVVVIDTLNRSIGGDENSSLDMGAFRQAADAIRAKFKCTVLIVHHTGYDEGHMRGHTSMAGAADAIIGVKMAEDGTVACRVEKMKDGESGAEIYSRLQRVELDPDDDGDPVTSCVVEPVDEAARPVTQSAKLTGPATIALKLLDEAIETGGETPPADNHIPTGVRAVKVNAWRDYCYKGSVSESDEPEARRKAFGRASDRLQSAGVIGIWNGWAWRT